MGWKGVSAPLESKDNWTNRNIRPQFALLADSSICRVLQNKLDEIRVFLSCSLVLKRITCFSTTIQALSDRLSPKQRSSTSTRLHNRERNEIKGETMLKASRAARQTPSMPYPQLVPPHGFVVVTVRK